MNNSTLAHFTKSRITIFAREKFRFLVRGLTRVCVCVIRDASAHLSLKHLKMLINTQKDVIHLPYRHPYPQRMNCKHTILFFLLSFFCIISLLCLFSIFMCTDVVDHTIHRSRHQQHYHRIAHSYIYDQFKNSTTNFWISIEFG